MKNIKKAVVLILSVLAILVIANVSFAATIQAKNETSNNTSNTSDTENTTNDDENTSTVSNNTANKISNNTSNNTSNMLGTTNNTTKINTTNTDEDLPNTGIEDTYLNFALILLLALVFGMFSLVQYNKIIKKEE